MRQQDHAGEVPDIVFRQRHPFHRRRFETLVQYICWICEDPRVLGLERLNRILWYVDRSLYLTHDRVATGATYVRNRAGPWARPLEAVLRELERKGLVAQRARVGDREPDLLLSLSKPDLGGFDPEDISLVEAITRAICFDNRSSIPGREAHENVLQAARLGEVIPYFTVFAGRPGECHTGDITWALRESERRAAPAKAPTAPADRLRQAMEGLLWHLLRDPSLGSSLPAAGSDSWFVYRQQAAAGSGLPDLTAVYRLDADELVVGGMRTAGEEDEDDTADDAP